VADLAGVVLFVVIAYAFTWASLLAYVVPNWGSLTTAEVLPYAMIGQFGPTLAALVLTGRAEGWNGIRALLSRLLVARFPLRWWFVATFSIGPVFLAVSAVIGASVSLSETMAWLVTRWVVVLLPVFGIASALLGAGPVGEEIAWRGYLQPRLIDRWSPALSSVIFGLIWSFWHLPAFFIPDWRHGLDLPLFVVLYPVSTIVLSYGMYYLWKTLAGVCSLQ
jgi:membrane protease YdiL (CAAX protease family)